MKSGSRCCTRQARGSCGASRCGVQRQDVLLPGENQSGRFRSQNTQGSAAIRTAAQHSGCGSEEKIPCLAIKPLHKAGHAKQGIFELDEYGKNTFRILPLSANPAERIAIGKEEQRNECAPTYKISRSKRYKACSDVSDGFIPDIFILTLTKNRPRIQRSESRSERRSSGMSALRLIK